MNYSNQRVYSFTNPVSAQQVLDKAAEIIADNYLRGNAFCNPQATKDFVKYKLGRHEREVFAILHLDNQHRLIEFEELFYGTIDSASVYPREIAKTCLRHNSAAVILAHNHPSGVPEPSTADKTITSKIVKALNLVGVRTLDHIIAGETCISMAEQGEL